MIVRRLMVALSAAALTLGAACSAGSATTPTADPTPTSSSAAPEPTAAATESATPAESTPEATPSATAAAAGPALTEQQLGVIFTAIMFPPDKYAEPIEMFESVYPDVTLSTACKNVMGVGDLAALDATIEFGASGDGSMTAVVASFADEAAASAYLGQVKQAAEACIADPQITFDGVPVADTTVVMTDGVPPEATERFGVEFTGTINDGQVSVIGTAARFGQDVLLLASWDPQTNTRYVPRAAAMFGESLMEERG